jgi:dTDP-glucose pyrophosphorylase
MNVLIPLGGLGKRFADEGFKDPKPLIKLEGKEMILHAIDSLGVTGRFFFVVRKTEYSDKLVSLLTEAKPDCVITVIDYLTEGPASSALLMRDYINTDEDLLIANCDQVMWWSGHQFVNCMQNTKYDGMIVTYYSNTPKNSYARVNRQGDVVEVKEKEVISNISLNGIHYWKHGKDFVSSAEEMISCNDKSINGEYYIGPTYNYLIKHNKKVGIFHIPDTMHNSVGTPDDLREYLRKL